MKKYSYTAFDSFETEEELSMKELIAKAQERVKKLILAGKYEILNLPDKPDTYTQSFDYEVTIKGHYSVACCYEEELFNCDAVCGQELIDCIRDNPDMLVDAFLDELDNVDNLNVSVSNYKITKE